MKNAVDLEKVKQQALLSDFLADIPESEPRLVSSPSKSKSNAEQQIAIEHRDGPCVIQAVAGCGKTYAVVHRIAAMVESGIPGERIVALTFAKKAAHEMNARLQSLGVSSSRVGTWHSLCIQILKEDNTKWSHWTIDDKDRARTFLKEILGFKGLKWENSDLAKVRRFIGICKANLWTWDSMEAREYAAKVFNKFEVPLAIQAYEYFDAKLQEMSILTYDDFLVFTYQWLLVEQNRQRWASKWAYMIVDEFQDNNRAQSTIAEMLVREHRNYMVVGDCAQAIYSFRGSSPDHIVAFQNVWSANRVAMVRNYRSGRSIVAAANAIIRPASVRMPEEMVAERELDGSVCARRVANFDAEGSEFAAWAIEHHRNGGSYSDICALFRTNAQSRALEEALLRAKIPYVLVGGMSFYERKEVKDLLGYLRVATGRDNSKHEAFSRCINAPFRYLGRVFVDRACEAANNTRPLHWPTLIRKVAQMDGVNRPQRASAEMWAGLIERVELMVKAQEKPDLILNFIINTTRYIESVEKDEGAESLDTSGAANVRELVRVSNSFTTVVEFLDYIEATIKAASKQKKSGQAGGERLLLMSVHRSKGLEWPKVWVVGCNELVLPHAKGDIEEERRLMYVAVTRARDELVCSYVAEFVTRAGIREGAPSRFLFDAGLVTKESA